MGELRWDISKDRAEFMGDQANSVRRQQFVAWGALQDPQKDFLDQLNNYHYALRSLFFELEGIAKDKDEDIDEERLKEIRMKLKQFDVKKNNAKDKPEKILRDLEEIDAIIRDLRIDLGIALGKEEDEDLGPEDLYE